MSIGAGSAAPAGSQQVWNAPSVAGAFGPEGKQDMADWTIFFPPERGHVEIYVSTPSKSKSLIKVAGSDQEAWMYLREKVSDDDRVVFQRHGGGSANMSFTGATFRAIGLDGGEGEWVGNG
jgi:hypothetical protein